MYPQKSQEGGEVMNTLTLEDLRLILSTIEGDRQGTWGSDRGDRLDLLGDKVLRIIKAKAEGVEL